MAFSFLFWSARGGSARYIYIRVYVYGEYTQGDKKEGRSGSVTNSFILASRPTQPPEYVLFEEKKRSLVRSSQFSALARGGEGVSFS